MTQVKKLTSMIFDTAVKLIFFASLTYIFSKLFFTQLSSEYHILYDFLKYLLRFLTFDLGVTEENVPVSFFMREGIKNSARIFLPSIAVALLLSYYLSYLYFRKKVLFAAKAIRHLGNIVTSVPIYWFALILFMAAAAIPFIPIAGVSSPLFGRLPPIKQMLDILQHMMLPCISIILPQVLVLTRAVEIKIDAINKSEFVRTARAKGLSEKYIFKKHLRKAVFAELLSQLHSILPLMITYLLIIENVYSYPGLGFHTISAYRYSYNPFISYEVAQSALVYLGIFTIIMQFIMNSLLQFFLPHFNEEKSNNEQGKPNTIFYILGGTTLLGFFIHIFNKTTLFQSVSLLELQTGKAGPGFRIILISAAFLTVIGLLIYVFRYRSKFAGYKMSVPDDNDKEKIQAEPRIKISPLRRTIESFRRQKRPWIKIAVSSAFIFALLIISFTVQEKRSIKFLSPPALDALMGTGPKGQDFFRQVLIAARFLIFPFFSAIAGAFLGTGLGLISGISRSRLLQTLIEFIEMFPSVIILIIVTRLAAGDIRAVLITLTLAGCIRFYRIISFQVVQLQRTNFILYSSLLGSSPFTLFRRHILPNIMPLFAVSLFYLIADIIVLEANLSFIGRLYSIKDAADLFPIEGWGRMLFNNKSHFLRNSWWLGLFPALFLVATAFSFRSIGNNFSRVLKR